MMVVVVAFVIIVAMPIFMITMAMRFIMIVMIVIIMITVPVIRHLLGPGEIIVTPMRQQLELPECRDLYNSGIALLK